MSDVENMIPDHRLSLEKILSGNKFFTKVTSLFILRLIRHIMQREN